MDYTKTVMGNVAMTSFGTIAGFVGGTVSGMTVVRSRAQVSAKRTHDDLVPPPPRGSV